MSISGINDVLKTGTSGSLTTLVDRSSNVRSLESNYDKELQEATVFGNTAKAYEVGLEDFKLSVTFKYDATIWGIINAMYDAGEAPTVEYSPLGTTSSQPKVTGVMSIPSMSLPAQVGDHKEFTVEFQSSDGNGATFGTN